MIRVPSPCMKLIVSLALSVMLVPTPARGGGWTSMGGDIVGDAMNPWFFRKADAAKRLVDYCIEVDEANFGVTKRQLYSYVEGSLRFWSDEFGAGAEPFNLPHLKFYLGTETFAYRPACYDGIPLRFQFGVLTAEQREKFAELNWQPRHHVAMAVRTDYDDLATMQAKGFIYISPARGPLAMIGADILPDPWADGRLSHVLRHELGHVFGMQHRGTSSDLMGAAFPERIVDQRTNWYGFTAGVFKVQLGQPIQYWCFGQDLNPVVREFFAIPAAHQCIKYKVNRSNLQIYSSVDFDDTPQLVGQANFDAGGIERPETVIRLWLPDGQTVFSNIPAYYGRILNGPMIKHTEVTGTLRTTSGLERQLHLHLSPERLQIGGILDGRIVMDAAHLR